MTAHASIPRLFLVRHRGRLVCRLSAGALALAVALGGPVGCRHKAADEEQPAKAGPEVPVQTTPIQLANIADTRTVYGGVVAQPSAVSVLSVAYESRVDRVLVAMGERVQEGTTLVAVGPSPDARLQFEQARSDLAAAQRALQEVRGRFEAHLATNSDLLKAEQDEVSARMRADTLRERGVGGVQELKSPRAGVVQKVSAQAGQLTPAGTGLVEVVPEDGIEVQLGVPAGDAARLTKDQEVPLSDVHDPGSKPVLGHIRLVPRDLDPQTRLVQVRVSLPADSALRVGSFVAGQLSLESKKTLVVPRVALVSADEKFSIYTVRDGHAVRHEVSVGIESGQLVEVVGGDLKAGDDVVVVGNSELADGMAVAQGNGR